MMPEDQGLPRNITAVTAGRSDQQKAEEYRDRMLALLRPVGELLTAATQDGLVINFQFGMPDGFKRISLVTLEVSKKLC